MNNYLVIFSYYRFENHNIRVLNFKHFSESLKSYDFEEFEHSSELIDGDRSWKENNLLL